MEHRAALPRWAEIVRQKYLAGEASTFVLYRNVFDIFVVDGHFVDLRSFLTGTLVEATKPRVVEVSAEFGVQCIKGVIDVDAADDLPTQLHALERLLRVSAGTAVVVPYADTLMPGEDNGFVSDENRKVATLFHRWSLDRVLNAGDNITFLIVETLGSLSQNLLSNPKVAAIEIPVPDLDTRLEVVRTLCPKYSESRQRHYAEWMAGLRSVQIEGLLQASGDGALSENQREALIAELLVGTPDAEVRAKRFAGITAGMTADEIVKLVEPTRTVPSPDPDDDLLRPITARQGDPLPTAGARLIS